MFVVLKILLIHVYFKESEQEHFNMQCNDNKKLIFRCNVNKFIRIEMNTNNVQTDRDNLYDGNILFLCSNFLSKKKGLTYSWKNHHHHHSNIGIENTNIFFLYMEVKLKIDGCILLVCIHMSKMVFTDFLNLTTQPNMGVCKKKCQSN